ncbi:putative NAD(P)H dehydrogenase (quinone) FQR1-like 2 isoform X2 [Silene latifolia]|uniref:putative NAD(P)H dehydrogenase (quinone) FQR1-like 2 isoform X2 n=1 Tax=Silene latifolia TaxID=37657 RepID=UPI003D773727
MGKGGGCVPSKKKHPPTTTTTTTASTTTPPPPKPSTSSSSSSTPTSPTTIAAAPAAATAPVNSISTAPLKLLIVFYSMYGHVEQLARRMKKGVDSVDGVEAVLYRVPETLSNDVLAQMMAPEKDDSIPVISSLEDLASGSGFLFGFPTRYGSMSAQMKAFFDSTGPLWKDQTLAGKPAGFFVSTGTQGGGQETTAKKCGSGAIYSSIMRSFIRCGRAQLESRKMFLRVLQ